MHDAQLYAAVTSVILCLHLVCIIISFNNNVIFIFFSLNISKSFGGFTITILSCSSPHHLHSTSIFILGSMSPFPESFLIWSSTQFMSMRLRLMNHVVPDSLLDKHLTYYVTTQFFQMSSWLISDTETTFRLFRMRMYNFHWCRENADYVVLIVLIYTCFLGIESRELITMRQSDSLSGIHMTDAWAIIPELTPTRTRPIISSSGEPATTHAVDEAAPRNANTWLNRIVFFLWTVTKSLIKIMPINTILRKPIVHASVRK